MTDKYPPAVQRPALVRLTEALGSRLSALHRDECGDWRIVGRYGWIYAVPGTEGFLIYYSGPEFIGSAKGWGYARRAFEAFGCTVTQNGDDEGIVFLPRLPTPEEAAIIRDKLVIGKKRSLSDGNLAAFLQSGVQTAFKPHRHDHDDGPVQG